MSRLAAPPAPAPSADFIVTKEHRRFVEFCDACRRYRYIGLCHGVPGVGKTLSARQYARWDLVESPASYYLPATEVPQEFITERTIVYTPHVAHAPRQVERTVQDLRRRVNALALRALQAQDAEGTGEAGRVPDLIIVDEADRLESLTKRSRES